MLCLQIAHWPAIQVQGPVLLRGEATCPGCQQSPKYRDLMRRPDTWTVEEVVSALCRGSGAAMA